MKTALQETFSELERLYPHLFDVHTEKGRDFINRFSIFLKLEEQQILNAHYDAYMNLGFEHLAIDCSEKYFNEIYKTKTIVTEFRDGSVKVETFKSE
jgi:hypothetical protein